MAHAPKPSAPPARPNRWSQQVTQGSKALDLAPGVFTLDDPREITRSLKASAELSQHRKPTPFRSAMSMLNFYIDRAGRQFPESQRARLEVVKDELRARFGRPRK